MGEINWLDPKCQITEHFSVHEALYLPTWGRLATEEDGLNDDIKDNLVNLCFILEKVRTLIGEGMTITSMYRPPEYSILVGGNAHDPHVQGKACDFHGEAKTIDEIKEILLPKLEDLGIRMERGTTTWVHIDYCPVIHNRYFNP